MDAHDSPDSPQRQNPSEPAASTSYADDPPRRVNGDASAPFPPAAPLGPISSIAPVASGAWSLAPMANAGVEDATSSTRARNTDTETGPKDAAPSFTRASDASDTSRQTDAPAVSAVSGNAPPSPPPASRPPTDATSGAPHDQAPPPPSNSPPPPPPPADTPGGASGDEPPPPPKKRKRSWISRILIGLAALAIAAIAVPLLAGAFALIVMAPNLPSLDAITAYHPKEPLRIFTADHVQIAEFGEERRRFMPLNQIPDVVKKAVLAIEDARYYEHGGVDIQGVLRAGIANFTKGESAQGASTITMQVARNFFLSSEKTYTRKIYEMLLAYKIEAALSKDQILELYMNQIYLGQRAYGFAAASRVYFGKDLKDVSLAQAAMLAGLPKAPSAYNPIVNPKRAKVRQEYILKRMLELGFITQPQYDDAIREPIRTRVTRSNQYTVHAEYIAEMVRQLMVAQYHEEAYTLGLDVTTTIDSADQQTAYEAVRRGVMDYERRHGYRGPEAYIKLPATAGDDTSERDQAIDDALDAHPDNGELIAGVVLAATAKSLQVALGDGVIVEITGEGLRPAQGMLTAKAGTLPKMRPGAVVRLVQNADSSYSITQLPQVEAALISVTPQDGAIRALVGGFDFHKNKFNHVTQAWRQPGSSFKPFIYSASLEKGLGPATIINDAPLYFPPNGPGQEPWAPKNYAGGYDGPITMRTALQKSKNMVSIRILQYIGPKYAQNYITRFGFDAERHPAYLPMALGAGLVTPLQMATAYSVFANGGYRVNPYLIAEVSDQQGHVVASAKPLVASMNAPRAIDPRNEYVMTSLLKSVAQRGTGAHSNVLGRTDLGGKTGTTNDSRDAWFAGFQHTVATIAWIGYDQPRSLGDKETGGGLALPIWIDYMRHALKGVPSYQWPMPPGVEMLGDEVYYDQFTPGNGFVATIGVDEATLAEMASGASGASGGITAGEAAPPGAFPAAPPPPPPGSVSPDEKQGIMDLFRRH
ncbi:penicillin-binding protein 1A [Pararobbsia alpina]|uniref:penicillin-binding protein 1A n=1 Tax=Pararobbsia alpina TaxID=621374 RepID=UPI0039A4AD09